MKQEDLYVAGIGASAGGLEALGTFFSAMKELPDCAIVIVQHLKREVKSQLPEILSGRTGLPVVRIKDGMRLEKNKVYVMPENKKLDVINRTLVLSDRPQEETINAAIDYFLFSLSEDVKDKAIAVILSGTGSDGTDGCHAVEGNGGVVIVQDPETAAFDGMPLSSIQYDHPDYIIAPQEMPELIRKIVSGREDLTERKRRRLLN